MELILLLGFAFTYGALHAFGPDHVAAVSAFAVRRPRPREAMGFGVLWAAGHGGILVLLGTALVAAGLNVPDAYSHGFERVVGATLVLLGAWTALSSRTLHAHPHRHADGTTHAHLHSHLVGMGHRHGHAVTAIGALHGLAGTAPVVALLPAIELDSPALAAGYLLLFAAGTAIGMAVYALFAGWIAGRFAVRSERFARGITLVTGLATLGIGVWWMLR